MRKCTICGKEKTLDKYRDQEKWCRSCRVQSERENRSLSNEEFEDEMKKMDLHLEKPGF